MQSLSWDVPEDQQLIIDALQRNEVILGSSDTIPGLFASLSQISFQKLNQIKNRSGKPYLILIDSPKKMLQFIKPPSKEINKLIQTFWPGPLTLLLNAKEGVRSFMKSEGNAIALRIPEHKGLLKVLYHVSGLFSTSANISGMSPPRSLQDVNFQIQESVSAIVSDRKGVEFDSRPSTILDCTAQSPLIVREGRIPKAQLEKALGYCLEKIN